MKPGDAIAALAQPIAKGIDYLIGTDIQHCPGCHERRKYLNTFYDRFFNKGVTQMQFIITKQIAVEAESPEEAVTKLAEGKTISISVNPRPQPVQPVQRPQTITG